MRGWWNCWVDSLLPSQIERFEVEEKAFGSYAAGFVELGQAMKSSKCGISFLHSYLL